MPLYPLNSNGLSPTMHEFLPDCKRNAVRSLSRRGQTFRTFHALSRGMMKRWYLTTTLGVKMLTQKLSAILCERGAIESSSSTTRAYY